MQVIAHHARLEEQRQLHYDEIVSLGKVGEDFLVDPLMDPSMSDFVQFHSLLGVVENNIAQRSSVQLSGLCEYFISKYALDFLPRRLPGLDNCEAEVLIKMNFIKEVRVFPCPYFLWRFGRRPRWESLHP